MQNKVYHISEYHSNWLVEKSRNNLSASFQKLPFFGWGILTYTLYSQFHFKLKRIFFNDLVSFSVLFELYSSTRTVSQSSSQYCPKRHQIFTELFIFSTFAKSLLTNTVSWRSLWESFLTKSWEEPNYIKTLLSVVLFTVLDKKYIKPPPTNSSKFVSSDQIRFIQ